MTKLWRRVVLPVAVKYREKLLAHVRSSYHFRDTFTPPDVPVEFNNEEECDNAELAADLLRKSKILLTVDGCWEQMHAVRTRLNKLFVNLNCEGFKFAAASTMVQQPNDVGRMHCNIHAYYKSNKYLCAEDFRVPKVMAPMKGVLQSSGLDPASFRTYWKALCLLPDCLVKSCAPDVVIDGYKKSGIWPVDNNAIMSGWSGWSKLNSTVAVQVLQKIPQLTLLAKKGRLFDLEIEREIGDLLEFDDSSRKADDCAINHGRCIWTNHPEVMMAESLKETEAEMEEIRRDNATMEKEWRANNPVEAAEDDARVARRNSPIDGSSTAAAVAAPLPAQSTGIKCSNPLCATRGDKNTRKAWTGCRKKKCRNLFCTLPDCVIMSGHHQTICEK